jgi:hypothetical protein
MTWLTLRNDCVTNDDGYIPCVVIRIISVSPFMTYHQILTRGTYRETLVELDRETLVELDQRSPSGSHEFTPGVLLGSRCVMVYALCCALSIIWGEGEGVAMVLAFLQHTASDYPFDTIRRFLKSLELPIRSISNRMRQ